MAWARSIPFFPWVVALLTAASGLRAADPPHPCGGIFAGLGFPAKPATFHVDRVVPGRAGDTVATPRDAAPYEVSTTLSKGTGVGVEVNGVWVTRDGPTGLLAHSMMNPVVMELLRQQAAAKQPSPWTPYKGKKVLFLGEGLDPRAGDAAKEGVEVRSVDLWYDPAVIAQYEKFLEDGWPHPLEEHAYQPLVDYYKKHKDYLVAGSVLDIPYADGSFDSVQSQRLLNNLGNTETQVRAVREMVRVVAVGGEIRIRPNELTQNADRQLREELGDRFRFEEDRWVRLR